MAVLNSVQLPDGTVYDLQDAVGNYATQTYVDNAVAGVTKGTIGLGNVDNTSDLNKPISTATQTALNAKANNTIISNVESSTTASNRYEIGEHFILNGVMYVATTIIANGDTIEEGTNCEVADPITKQIEDKNSRKKYLLISDSYGGYTFDGVTYSWIDDVIELTGIDATKLTQGSIGFRPAHDNVSSFYKLLNDAIEGGTLGNLNSYTDIIVCGGANDIGNISQGAITKAELITKIGEFNDLCKANFPNATLYIGFIGNYKSGNYSRAYYSALEAYRECRRFGVSYLENVEYILGMEYIKSSDGVHPTPDGFDELAKYLSEAVINKMCFVNRPARISENTSANDTVNVGAWNVVPPTRISQNNGHQKVVFMQAGIGLTLVANNRLALDSVVSDLAFGDYKLFGIGELLIGQVKGGAYITDHYEPYFCGECEIKLTATDNTEFAMQVPVALILGKLYLCLPKSAAYAALIYGTQAIFSKTLIYIRMSQLVIDIDGSNYNGYI